MDSKAAIDIGDSLKQHGNLKHINVCVQFIRSMINDRVVKLLTVKSENNVADIHTKCLPTKIFKNHRGKIMHGFGNDQENIHKLMNEYI